MGYTNHWTPNLEKINNTVEFPKEMLEQMEKVRATFNDDVMAGKIEAELISSVTLGDTICLSGTCEGFEFDLCKDSRLGERIGVDTFTFCKTARDPYDMAVKCFLMLLQRYGFITRWNHEDSNRSEIYKDAIKFAKRCGIDTRGVYAKRY